MNDTDTGEGSVSQRPDDGLEWRIVLKLLGFGLAGIDSEGLLTSADDRFLQIHGIDPSSDNVRERVIGHHLTKAIASATGDPLAAAWERLLGAPEPNGEGRTDVSLADGRKVEIALGPKLGRTAVLAAREADANAASGERLMLQRSLAHEVNNSLGGMLANLYLALSDMEASHPSRGRVEAVNDAVIDLRSRIRQIAT